MLANSRFSGAWSGHCPNILFTLNTPEKGTRRGVVVFRVHGNFCALLEWSGGSSVIYILHAPCLLLKVTNNKRKNKVTKEREEKPSGFCQDCGQEHPAKKKIILWAARERTNGPRRENQSCESAPIPGLFEVRHKQL